MTNYYRCRLAESRESHVVGMDDDSDYDYQEKDVAAKFVNQMIDGGELQDREMTVCVVVEDEYRNQRNYPVDIRLKYRAIGREEGEPEAPYWGSTT